MNADLGVVAFTGKVFFWVGIVTFCIGTLILVSPALVMRVAGKMNRWVPTDAWFRRLDSPKVTERLFYRHHRIFGALLVIGTGYVIYQFVWGIDYAAVFGRAEIMGSHAAAAWLAATLGFIAIVFSVVVFGIGVVVFFRPSILKRLERRANTWFAADQSLKRLDEQVSTPDRIFIRIPRLVGLLVILGSLYVIVSLRLFMWKG